MKYFLSAILILSLMILAPCAQAQQKQPDTLTITTYYPAPYGEYKQIKLSPTDEIDPSSSCNNQGAMYYDKSDNEVYVCDGNNWKSFGVDLVWFDKVGIALKDGATAYNRCRDHDYYGYGYARYTDGKIQTRAQIKYDHVPALNCDSGWVNGLAASCSASRTIKVYPKGTETQTTSIQATSSSTGVEHAGHLNTDYRCGGSGAWGTAIP